MLLEQLDGQKNASDCKAASPEDCLRVNEAFAEYDTHKLTRRFLIPSLCRLAEFPTLLDQRNNYGMFSGIFDGFCFARRGKSESPAQQVTQNRPYEYSSEDRENDDAVKIFGWFDIQFQDNNKR